MCEMCPSYWGFGDKDQAEYHDKFYCCYCGKVEVEEKDFMCNDCCVEHAGGEGFD